MRIPESYLVNLNFYKYSSIDNSLLSRHLLNPYWNYLVSLFPNYIAPNSITFAGLLFIVANLLSLFYYDPSLECSVDSSSCPPNWIYFSWAIGLFLYQSFDAIDGKQARKTGMAGPLGELFDHGCDALNTTLEVILSAAALNIGTSWWLVLSQIATIANFYLSTWEEYHTGTLYLSVFSGPVEGIIIIVILYIITGIFGPQIWSTSLINFIGWDIKVNEAFMAFAGVGLFANVYTAYSNVQKSRKSKNISSPSPLYGLLPFLYQTVLNVLWASAPTSIIFNTNYQISPLLIYLIQWGFQFSHLVGLVILGHVAKVPFPSHITSMFVVLCVAIDGYLPTFGLSSILHSSEQSSLYTLYGMLIINAMIWLTFAWFTVKDICEHQGIKCFRVLKRSKDGAWVVPNEMNKNK
ncbi:Choline/ethanolaminephosphotransferase [Wallemia mellicola]|uniref:diacylglycerol cholinephosphotransferase n=2 Tax=Wallemia mellicola TaxID=1708541 RepID=A0A4V4MQC2_9BASI|nr:Choline/ethanolaminephosphotransferase [Wallemia mellicola CBS 633.66]TIB69069.1 hypothetical protein E3Q24_03457 [Wallemia mellicola]EIM21256.1 Choline/ethanolaminephosphotransferase [Wallemia mellicola CBS 633.66]TIB81333.1 Choline/ethanolaminephosphotransferase [Wallemia mellicola]TIB94067.1 Choline/ethanolaminephosphotransferase [Wallemia mellicola]TIC01865.1 Choline/ethanolaminephosphotransferase [Wallemia mellicola]|eukprot:XP_006958610.1 Choline/ethanolaminephosphotransferase [Wallemia mellicola CBS 633.66]